MKKFALIAAVLAMACFMAAPAMAADFSATGYLRVDGFSEIDLDTATSNAKTNSWYQMRVRISPRIQVNDNVALIARLDILDNYRWGTNDNPSVNPNQNLDWDRFWMSLNLPMNLGKLEVGRKSGGTFGNVFYDSAGERDRIQWTYPMGNFTLLALTEKLVELDYTPTFNSVNTQSDQDYDGYVLAGIYKMENWTVGLLYEFLNDKRVTTQDTRGHLFIPYFVGSYGDFVFQGEVDYITGKREFDAVGVNDLDLDVIAYNLEAGYTFGPLYFELGFAHSSGDTNPLDQDLKHIAGHGHGDDPEKMWILQGSTGNVIALGPGRGVGNLSDSGGNVGGRGGQMFYGGVKYQMLENLDLGLWLASAKTDEVFATEDDKMGTEVDVRLNWKIMDNLTYHAVFAYLDVGDFYRTATVDITGAAVGAMNPLAFEDKAYVWWHRLIVDF